MNKLSPSGIVDYLRSPKSYYWSRVYNNGAGLEPLEPSVQRYDHDKVFGIAWAAFVARFYQNQHSEDNLLDAQMQWLAVTNSWVPDKVRKPYDEALVNLAQDYYTQFSPQDGCRTESEVWVENDFLRGRLDGINDGHVFPAWYPGILVHEVKTTSRSPQLAEQLWKVENSIQVKAYAVLAKAEGVQIEFAFKDVPQVSWRAPIKSITEEMRDQWRREIHWIALDIMYANADNIGAEAYPCNPDGCCLVTKRFVGMCPYQVLCANPDKVTELAATLFKPRTRSKDYAR